MTKYVGAMVRKSSQFTIAAEQDHFENKSGGTKKTQLFLPTGALKKQNYIHLSNVLEPIDSLSGFLESPIPAHKKVVLFFDGIADSPRYRYPVQKSTG